ncbi:hypothetical protein [Paraburkholderia xenovorans]|uniref:hypothetical protein n=1 Tax=Paraburkholderia xenovorans TaxID=36873 RepID=UPI0015C57A38|nr:hypothetical protein [Paraburkholderia xenovorans]NPT36335.1 hypothetical protein [Paraburkholderia xenovorans]
MYSLEEIRQQARTSVLYDDQHPEGTPGMIHLINGKTVRCFYRPQHDCHTWYIGVDRARECEVQALLSQHRQ